MSFVKIFPCYFNFLLDLSPQLIICLYLTLYLVPRFLNHTSWQFSLTFRKPLLSLLMLSFCYKSPLTLVFILPELSSSPLLCTIFGCFVFLDDLKSSTFIISALLACLHTCLSTCLPLIVVLLTLIVLLSRP